METVEGGNALTAVGTNGRSCEPVGNFHQFSLTHHEHRHQPASDHPKDKKEEERGTRRRPRPLRLQETEEGSRCLSLRPDGRPGGFLEHERLSGIPSDPPKLSVFSERD